MNDQTNKPLTFFRFENLRIYHKALDYSLWVKNICREVRTNDCMLADDFCKTSQQIPVSIAKGSVRDKSTFIIHLKEAKCAVRASLVLGTIAHRMQLISDLEEDESRNQLMEMTKMLGALISSLQKNTTVFQEQYDEESYSTQNW